MYAPAAMNGIVTGANTPTATDTAIMTPLRLFSMKVIHYVLVEEMYLFDFCSVHKFAVAAYSSLHTVAVDTHQNRKFHQHGSDSLCLELCSSKSYVLV